MSKKNQPEPRCDRSAVMVGTCWLVVLACLAAAGSPALAAGQAAAGVRPASPGAGLTSAVGVVRQKLAGDPVPTATAASTSEATSLSPSNARVAVRAHPPGLRDPFKLPPPPSPVSSEEWRPPANRPPGKRGLLIGELRVEGIVRQDSSQRMMAVVTNETNRAYFLREGDALYDGVVTRITPDAVYFRETMLGRSGGSRDVVKPLSSGGGGQR
jgi:hypothetical protein